MKEHIEGQEEACAALWDFAHDVLELSAEERGSLAERPRMVKVPGVRQSVGVYSIPVTDAQLATIRRALERIVKGFGYTVAEIQ